MEIKERASKEKLLKFGFLEKGDFFEYSTPILDGQFTLTVRYFPEENEIKTSLYDALSDDLYTLHLVEGAEGEFVGAVRAAYGRAMDGIYKSCFEKPLFGGNLGERVANYILEKYGDSPEFLWEKFPDTAIWRRRDNRKWYGIIMNVNRAKLSSGEGEIQIMNVSAEPQNIDRLADGKRFFRGYHMNKKSWLTIPLDGSISPEEIFKLIDESYLLVGRKIR